MPKIVESRLTDRTTRTLPDGENLDGAGSA